MLTGNVQIVNPNFLVVLNSHSIFSCGLNIKQAAYAVKKYTSQRRVPADIVMDVNVL
jgi:hypothetical protein